MPDRRRPNPLREAALTLAAVLGGCCLVSTVIGLALGIQPLVFGSGSMEPTIGTGALALARTVPADELAVGDVVSVDNAVGVRVTHRIVAVAPQGDGRMLLTLKGDANVEPDVEAYPVRSADRVLGSVPALGYVVTGLSARPVVFLAGVLAGAVAVVVLGRRRAEEETDREPARRGGSW